MIATENMKYNTQREHMVIPEFGRNIQNLIEYCKAEKDDKKRQDYAERIVHLMLQMNPQSKNIVEYKEKLWTQFFIIADFDIDVTPPSGIVPTREILNKKPLPLNYPLKTSKFRHYGNNVNLMINQAIEMEDGPIKDGFLVTIGSFMKLAFRTWNSDHHVSDDQIKADFVKISQGKLTIPADVSLDALNNSAVVNRVSPTKHHSKRKNHKGGYKKNKSSNKRK